MTVTTRVRDLCVANLNRLRDESHSNAVERGFHESPQPIPEAVALMHSELSELLEDFRAGKRADEVWYEVPKNFTGPRVIDTLEFTEQDEDERIARVAKPCGIPSEIADVIIRALDFCGLHKIDVEKAVAEKMVYNRSRPYRHGGKKI